MANAVAMGNHSVLYTYEILAREFEPLEEAIGHGLRHVNPRPLDPGQTGAVKVRAPRLHQPLRFQQQLENGLWIGTDTLDGKQCDVVLYDRGQNTEWYYYIADGFVRAWYQVEPLTHPYFDLQVLAFTWTDIKPNAVVAEDVFIPTQRVLDIQESAAVHQESLQFGTAPTVHLAKPVQGKAGGGVAG